MIAIFVDKDFLNDFFLMEDELSSFEEVNNILTGFAEKVLFHNFENPEDFLKNPIGKKIASNGVTTIIHGGFNDFLLSNPPTKICFSTDKIALTKKEILRFKISDLDKKISDLKLKTDWVVYLDDKEERKQLKKKWRELTSITINSIQLIDKYLPKKREIFIDFCKEYISSLEFNNLKVDIFSNNLTKDEYNTEKEKEQIRKLSRALNSTCPSRISTVNYYRIFSELRSIIDFHDRVLITNLYLLDIGVGFDNLLTSQETNSKLVCTSILNEDTYNRVRRLRKKIDKYKIELRKQVKVPTNVITNIENCK